MPTPFCKCMADFIFFRAWGRLPPGQGTKDEDADDGNGISGGPDRVVVVGGSRNTTLENWSGWVEMIAFDVRGANAEKWLESGANTSAAAKWHGPHGCACATRDLPSSSLGERRCCKSREWLTKQRCSMAENVATSRRMSSKHLRASASHHRAARACIRRTQAEIAGEEKYLARPDMVVI